jgi:hypothetical protein
MVNGELTIGNAQTTGTSPGISARGMAFPLRRAAELALLAGPAVFQAIIVLVQVRQPGYNPLRDTISSLVWGTGGWLQTVNFFLVGFMLLGMAWTLRSRLRGKITGLTGCFSLGLMGVGFIILGIFPAREAGGPQTLRAMVHGVTVYSIILLFLAACFFLASSLRDLARSRAMFVYTIATGVLCAFFIVAGIFIMIAQVYWFGILERVLLLDGFIWLEVVMYLALGRSDVSDEAPERSEALQ